jgi:hypothetical protein
MEWRGGDVGQIHDMSEAVGDAPDCNECKHA